MFGDAIEEIGGDAHDLDKWHDFSKPTMSALGDVQRPAKTYWQMALAYGICGLAMLPGGALIVFFAEGEPVLIAAGVVMLAMGAGLVFLAAQALANWRIAQKLENDY